MSGLLPAARNVVSRHLGPIASTSSTIASSSAASRTSRRALHHRVPLPYPVQDGVSDFLSPAALKTISVDWQEGVLGRLNELTKGTIFADLSVFQTVKQTAADPSQALVFNYASEALNNSFFLSTLQTSTNSNVPNRSSAFSEALTKSSLRSYAGLVSHFSAHVSGLHPSSGAYVWLATDENGNLGVLGTYAGGTLLVQGGRRMGKGTSVDTVVGEKIDVPEEASASAAEGAASPSDVWKTSAPSSGSNSSSTPSSPGTIATLLDNPFGTRAIGGLDAGRQIHPLVCVSVHPHCYLQDYGVWGREEYVKRWWGSVDWKAVEDSYSSLMARTRGP